MEGWICLHRKILKWEWYQDTNTFRVFMHLLLSANWEDTKYMGMLVKRGSLVIKQVKLAEELKLSHQQVRTSLLKLKSSEIITIKTYNKFSLVTIVNYSSYQDKEINEQQAGNNQITSRQQTNNKQITSIDKQEKQINNITNNRNYINIISLYNSLCKSYPKVSKLSDARKKAINARLNKYTINDFEELFKKAEESDFLKGNNNRNWKADFDWLIKDTNLPKVLEGKYDNGTRNNISENKNFKEYKDSGFIPKGFAF